MVIMLIILIVLKINNNKGYAYICIYIWIPGKVNEVHFINIKDILNFKENISSKYFENNKLKYECKKGIYNFSKDLIKEIKYENNKI